MRGVTVLVLLSLVLLAPVHFWSTLRTPRDPGAEEVLLPVAPTTPYGVIVGQLWDLELVGNRVPLLLLGRLTGTHRMVRYGTYRLSAAMRPWDIFLKLRSGGVEEARITVPEGSNIYEIARILEKARVVSEDDLLRAARDPDLLNALGLSAGSAEGYCFPDTYRFPLGTPGAYVVRAMVSRFRERVGPILEEKDPPAGLHSAGEVISLASIVEREARIPEERDMVAGVYLNRLRRGMRLEADPTAVYGVKLRGDRVTAEDIRRRTPYNTYQIPGLPPGPIGNPGTAAVRAVLVPRTTDALYFVATGDGRHVFSASYREHRRAVRRLARGARR